MLDNELISIITPAYNAGRFIRDTILSVQSQSYKNWELLIVDDQSTDHTCEIVSHFSDDERIKLIRHSDNCGPACARNTALKAAKGNYIAFLDSDDIWLKDKLFIQLECMKKDNLAFTYTSYRRISESGDSIGRKILIPNSLTYNQLLGNTAITTSTVMINREITGFFEMKETYYDDFSCWLEILKKGAVAVGIHNDLVKYRIVGKSVSRNKIYSAMMVWKAYRDVEKLNIFFSIWCFLNYSWNAFKKYKIF